jgi:hypothetical protein
MANNGNELQKNNFDQHVKTFLAAYVDPRVEKYTRNVGVHEVLEISKFLKMIGHQKIQCTLNLDDTTISFIFKTTSNSVKYIQVTHGRVPDSTINLDVDLNWITNPTRANLLKTPAYLFQNNMSIKKLWSTFRLFIAAGTELIASALPTSTQK